MIPDPSVDPLASLGALVNAVRAGQWPSVLALAVVLVVFLVRRYGGRLPKVGPKVEAFLKSDPGGVLTAFLVAFGAAIYSAPALTWGALATGCKVAFLAMGGYATAKKLLGPALSWLLGKLFPSRVEAVKAEADKVATEKTSAATGCPLDGIK